MSPARPAGAPRRSTAWPAETLFRCWERAAARVAVAMGFTTSRGPAVVGARLCMPKHLFSFQHPLFNSNRSSYNQCFFYSTNTWVVTANIVGVLVVYKTCFFYPLVGIPFNTSSCSLGSLLVRSGGECSSRLVLASSYEWRQWGLGCLLQTHGCRNRSRAAFLQIPNFPLAPDCLPNMHGDKDTFRPAKGRLPLVLVPLA